MVDDFNHRAATLLLGCSRAYWTFTERPEIDLDEAVRRAREILNFCGEVAQADSDQAPDHQPLIAACGLLGVFGDGYALHSVEWPEGQPVGALPDRAAMELNLRSLKAREWAQEILSHDYRDHVVEPEVTTNASTDAPEDQNHLHSLRAKEKPDWDGYGEAGYAAASALLAWIDKYRRVVRLLDGGDDAFLATVTTLRTDVLHTLAWARTAVGSWHVHGAQAEAILAAGLLSSITRSIFLIGTADDLADLRDLHILRIDSLDEFLSSHALDGWAETVVRETA